jgi:hypothetical protein
MTRWAEKNGDAEAERTSSKMSEGGRTLSRRRA